jgi:hypothetical protein
VDELSKLVLKADTVPPEMLIEALGILSNMTLASFDFKRLVTTYDFLPHIFKTLSKSVVVSSSTPNGSKLTDKDDLLLEWILLLGTFCLDKDVVPLISDQGFPSLLLDVMIAKEEDDEIVLQILFVFKHLLGHSATQQKVMTLPGENFCLWVTFEEFLKLGVIRLCGVPG